MNCDSCGNWVCLKCTKLPPALYNELSNASDDEVDTITWYCTVCKGMAPDLKSMNKNIVDLKLSNDEKLANVEKKINDLESSVKETVKKEVEAAKTDINESVQKNLSNTVSDLVDSRLKEMDDRKNRAANLVLFNVVSLDDENPQNRKEHDTMTIKKLYEVLTGSDDELMIRTCFRLGKKKPTDKNEVPLKVVCDAKSQRRKLLQNATKISELADTYLKKIVISRDLIEEQRKANRERRKDKDDRVARGEKVHERHGEVVEDREESPS